MLKQLMVIFMLDKTPSNWINCSTLYHDARSINRKRLKVPGMIGETIVAMK